MGDQLKPVFNPLWGGGGGGGGTNLIERLPQFNTNAKVVFREISQVLMAKNQRKRHF